MKRNRNVRSAGRRGFTLVELLVSVSMSMGVALGVFALAGQGVRTFTQESRLGDAQINALTGFERMRADIARAGFHVTPNIKSDPHVCGPPASSGPLSNLAAIRINTGSTPNNGIVADSITLAGAYSYYEQFHVDEYDNTTGNHVFRIDTRGADARMRQAGVPIDEVFKANQLLRVQTPEGNEQYLTIEALNDVSSLPMDQMVNVTATGHLYTKGGYGESGYPCGVHGLCRDCLINPVNLIQYRVVSLFDDPNYQHLYASEQFGQFYDDEDSRLELVRVELDANGQDIVGSTELIAEYVVGLDFGIHVAEQNGAAPQLRFFDSDDSTEFSLYAGAPEVNGGGGPQLLRGVRARLSVRSRQADRFNEFEHDSKDPLDGTARHLYPLGTTGSAFARVRNIQSDIALNNLYGMNWQ